MGGFKALALVLCPTIWLVLHEYGKLQVKLFMESRNFEVPISELLARSLREEPRRSLEPGAKERFDEDGVLLVRGVIKNMDALRYLRQVSVSTYAWNVLPVNGPMLSLARDSPLGPLASELLGGKPVRVWSGQFFNKGVFHSGCHDQNSFSKCDTPHLDLDAEANGELLPFVSAWVALSEANNPVGYILGSHTARHPCGYSDHAVDDGCLVELAANLTRKLGRPSIASFSLAPGDVVFFYNQVFHYGTETPKRAGASVRYVAADYGFQGPIVETNDMMFWYSHAPRQCSPLGSGYLFPLADAPEEVGKWPRGWPLYPLYADVLLASWRSLRHETADTFRPCRNYA